MKWGRSLFICKASDTMACMYHRRTRCPRSQFCHSRHCRINNRIRLRKVLASFIRPLPDNIRMKLRACFLPCGLAQWTCSQPPFIHSVFLRTWMNAVIPSPARLTLHSWTIPTSMSGIRWHNKYSVSINRIRLLQTSSHQ